MTRLPDRSARRLTSYERFVVVVAWLGLGFDIMDVFLFNYVAPLAVPDLLGLAARAPETKSAITFWTGVLTSVMLVGWTLGGVAFGRLSDRLGRTRTVVLTMLIYSLGTAACAFAPNIAVLAVFRFVAALGIGGEWAASATLVAETVPEERRVSMGTLLATASSAGGFFAIFAARLFTSEIDALAARPDLAWRFAMGFGALPAVLALVLRRRLREPERWVREPAARRAQVRDLFTPELRRRTLGGAAVATLTLLTFWATNTFLPVLATFLADDAAGLRTSQEALALRASYVTRCLTASNLGSLTGMLIAVPVAKYIGRRPLYFACFAWAAASIVLVFALHWPGNVRILLVAVVGLPIGAAISSFHYYLPELFPARLRGTGAGFCMNAGRILTVFGPTIVGVVAGRGVPVLQVLTAVAVAPVLGLVLLAAGWVVETKDEPLDATRA